MSEENIREIVKEVMASQQPSRQQAIINFINPILVTIASTFLITTASYMYNLMGRVDNVEVRLNNMVDLNVYQSRMIDYNFRVVADPGSELNEIYIPEMVFSRGGGGSTTQKNRK